MRHATQKELGYTGIYRLVPVFFGTMFVLMLSGLPSATKDRDSLITLAIFFFVTTALTTLWPLWRVREAQGVRFARLRSGTRQFDGVLIPISRARRIIVLVGSSFLAVSCLFLAMQGNERGTAKLWLGAIFFSGFAAVWAGQAFARTQGILLCEGGILWHKILQPAVFVPWAEVLGAAAFRKRENESTAPCLGLVLRNVANVETKTSTRAEMEKAHATQGWHLQEDGEALLAPLEAVAAAIYFYRDHPPLRAELASGAAANRMEALAREVEAAPARLEPAAAFQRGWTTG
jgi:hypothetical protein